MRTNKFTLCILIDCTLTWNKERKVPKSRPDELATALTSLLPPYGTHRHPVDVASALTSLPPPHQCRRPANTLKVTNPYEGGMLVDVSVWWWFVGVGEEWCCVWWCIGGVFFSFPRVHSLWFNVNIFSIWGDWIEHYSRATKITIISFKEQLKLHLISSQFGGASRENYKKKLHNKS